MPFYFVRHPRVVYPEGNCFGATDVPADAAHTAECAARLAAKVPQRALVVSSPLSRCTGLAAGLVRLRPDLRWCTDGRIAEMDFGCWEGVPWEQIPRSAFDAWMADFGNHAFGGATSVNTFLDRVASAWDEWSAAPVAAESGVVWVGHAGVARALRWLAGGRRVAGLASEWPQEAIAHGELWQL